jgi:hypothetical protein
VIKRDSGALETANDFYSAAFIFQHGEICWLTSSEWRHSVQVEQMPHGSPPQRSTVTFMRQVNLRSSAPGSAWALTRPVRHKSRSIRRWCQTLVVLGTAQAGLDITVGNPIYGVPLLRFS